MLPVSKHFQKYYGRGDKYHYRPLVTYDDGHTYKVNYFEYKKADVPDKTSPADRVDMIDAVIRSLKQPKRIAEILDRHRAGENLLAVVKEYAPQMAFIHLLK